MKWLHYLFIVSLLLFSCKGQNVKNKRPTRLLTDALQREVALPDTIRQLVCIRSSAIRLVTYAGGAPLICGVEEQETRPNEFTHIFAHPDLARLPIIGPGMGGDPELIMAAGPDVIFMTSTTAGEADALQKQTGIPVFTIEYGDLGRNRPTFYNSLQLIGQVLHTEDKVDSPVQINLPKSMSAAFPIKDKRVSLLQILIMLPWIIWKPTMWLLNSIRPTYPR